MEDKDYRLIKIYREDEIRDRIIYDQLKGSNLEQMYILGQIEMLKALIKNNCEFGNKDLLEYLKIFEKIGYDGIEKYVAYLQEKYKSIKQ